MDECASSPCYAAGTSSCTDLGINLFECKCLSDWSGVYCEVSEYVFEVTFALDDDVTSEEYAEQLELNLLSQFPDFQIDLLVVTDGNGVATFQITFWSNDDLEVPDEQELDIAFASAGYSGDLVDASYRSGDPEESGELGGVLTSRSSFFIAAGTTVTAVLLQ
jgi:hypothetical protein